jgi:DNA-binding transcriptional MerR regulator
MTTLPPAESEFTLADLTAAARALLIRAGVGAADDRISDFPDARTVRYYQSLGLVDRPSRYEGRAAIYGYRQLLQVLAVKLLQARGFSLSQVQGALTGVATERLEAAAREALGVPEPPPSPEPSPEPAPDAPVFIDTRGPRSLIAALVAPGVTLTLDPEVVPDPEAVLRRVAAALSTPLSSTNEPPEAS